MKLLFRIILFAAVFIAPFHGQNSSAQQVNKKRVEGQFKQWLAKDLYPKAAANGVSRQSFNKALSGVTINWKLPDLVPPGSSANKPRKQTQAEFRAPSRYFAKNTVDGVVVGGKNRLARHKDLLNRLEKKTGVPGRTVVAIWGRESAFGNAKIPHNAFQVLATKAFMSTRRELFERELLAALVMVEKGTSAKLMKSSWAGALGQPQFLPSSYLKYAADGDGNGKADIWNSEADTLASIANYLAANGWVAGRDWGFEVKVPASVSCALEGPDNGRPIAEWQAMGIERTSGRPFPANEINEEGFLMMPAGRFGPAFIVTPNFYVLKAYNESDLYALFIGHAGDRMAFNSAPFNAGWGKTDKMLRSDIAKFQRHLESLGHDVGGADGLPGFKTRRSIGKWQETKGIKSTCFPSNTLVRSVK
ncbi:MAG: lytic murein transglycosylase [Rhizobiaceae bacterium]